MWCCRLRLLCLELSCCYLRCLPCLFNALHVLHSLSCLTCLAVPFGSCNVLQFPLILYTAMLTAPCGDCNVSQFPSLIAMSHSSPCLLQCPSSSYSIVVRCNVLRWSVVARNVLQWPADVWFRNVLHWPVVVRHFLHRPVLVDHVLHWPAMVRNVCNDLLWYYLHTPDAMQLEMFAMSFCG